MTSTHINLALIVDFDKHQIRGSAMIDNPTRATTASPQSGRSRLRELLVRSDDVSAKGSTHPGSLIRHEA